MRAHPDADLSPEQSQEMSNQLKIKRQEMTDSIDSLDNLVQTKHDCDIIDAGDFASLNEERRRAAAILKHHEETIAEIDAALARLKSGRFGISETTGEPIAYERLLAIPWARTGLDD